MKRLGVTLLIVVLGGLGLWRFGADRPEANASAVTYRTARADTGAIVAQVSTAGAVLPLTTVIVGSQLSGQIVEILVDYNSEVKTGQLLARLNSDQVRAKLDAARAELAQARAGRAVLDAQAEKSRADAARALAVAADMRAQLEKSQTQLADAEKTLARQTDLSSQGIVSQTALQAAKTLRDTLTSQRASALAQIDSAMAQVASLAADGKMIAAQMLSSEAQMLQRAAMVRQIEVDLSNTDIRSPVDGVVIQRNVELGQPVAASLQAPTLFLVAQDLRRIQIQANVDEADVGRVRAGQPVSFSVNAYPGRSFEGTVKLVRLGSQMVQNVVIYTTVIEVENPNLDLKPGMTANLRILTERREGVVRIPNAALRWRPPASIADSAPAPVASAAAPQRAEAQRAEDDTAAGPFTETGEGRGGGRGGPGLFFERLKAELEMTDAQKEKLDALIAARPAPGRGGPGGGRQAREARDAMMNDIAALLTDAQKPKFTAMISESAGRGGRQGRGPRGGGERAGPGPSTQAMVTGRVYRLGDRGEPVGVTVRLGATDGAYTEAISGLAAGAAVITGGGAGKAERPGFRFGF